MASTLRRRSLLLGLSSLALYGCASDGDVAQSDAMEASLAELPLHVLMVQAVSPVHKALEPQLMLPVQAQAMAGNGSVPAVALALGAALQKGQSADVVLAPLAVLEQLQGQALVRPDSVQPLLRTPFVLVVQAGRTVPQIHTDSDVRQLMQRTRSLAYPSSDGSAFIEQSLFPQVGGKEAMLAKSIKVFGPQVAQLVARGDAEIGLVARSELQGASGITIVGPLPAPLGYASVYGAGIASHANSLPGAEALQRFYLREVAAHDWSDTGWESAVPVAKDAR